MLYGLFRTSIYPSPFVTLDFSIYTLPTLATDWKAIIHAGNTYGEKEKERKRGGEREREREKETDNTERERERETDREREKCREREIEREGERDLNRLRLMERVDKNMEKLYGHKNHVFMTHKSLLTKM